MGGVGRGRECGGEGLWKGWKVGEERGGVNSKGEEFGRKFGGRTVKGDGVEWGERRRSAWRARGKWESEGEMK